MRAIKPMPPTNPFKGKKVKCPCGCEHEFFVPRSHHGAQYAGDWKKLPGKHLELLAHLYSKYYNRPFSETEIIQSREFPITARPLGGRLSEYRRWDLILRHEIKTANSNIVKHSLNVPRVELVLNNGGSLLPLKSFTSTA